MKFSILQPDYPIATASFANCADRASDADKMLANIQWRQPAFNYIRGMGNELRMYVRCADGSNGTLLAIAS